MGREQQPTHAVESLRAAATLTLSARKVARPAVCLCRLMQVGGVKRSRVNARDGLSVQQLEEFASACKQIKFQPPLNEKQTAMLRDLQPDRPGFPVF